MNALTANVIDMETGEILPALPDEQIAASTTETSVQLVRYEAARVALAEAHRVDEVKDIRDKAQALAAYAKQAKDTAMVQWATEIKVRAERKSGELLQDMAKEGKRAALGNPTGSNQYQERFHDETIPPSLQELGISKTQSHRWQQLAAMPEEHFETAIETAKTAAGEVTTAFMLRAAATQKQDTQNMRGPQRYLTIEQWRALSDIDKTARITEGLKSRSVFNRQDANAEDSMGNIEWAKWSWNPVTGCKHDCPYCVSGDTLVLMADGRSVEMRSLRVGDKIIGTQGGSGYRRLVETEVLAHWKTSKPAYEITLADGRTIICSGDHRFLTERGWKFTAPGDVTRDWHGRLLGQRPALTPQNSLLGFGAAVETPLETDDYRRGYLAGVIRGDGHLKQHRDHRRGNSFYWSFRLAMKDGAAVDRASRYLAQFGVGVAAFNYVINATTGLAIEAIRTSTRAAFERITELIAWRDDAEFRRGFLAGIFDAEGSNNGTGSISVLRIYNSDPEILSVTEKALEEQGFRYVYDVPKQGMNKTVQTLRILGGLMEHIRFFQRNDPAVRRKLKLDGAVIKSQAELGIKSVRALGIELPMFDITTGTEDFIANGVVAHNCYARDIAERFYEQKFEPSFWPERLAAPRNTAVPASAERDISQRNVFSNSMSDLYGRWVPEEWINAILGVMRDSPQWNFLMLTKFPKRAAEFQYAENCWIGTSIDFQARVKAAEDAFERIECGVKWLSIEPLLEPLKFSRPELFNWVVIGGASRSSKTPEWTPPFEWIVRVASQFLEHGTRIYLKTNGRPREYPGVITPEKADQVFYYLKQVEK